MTVDAIQMLEINDRCAECFPCKHFGTLTFMDGTKRQVYLDALDMYTLIQAIAKERIINHCTDDHFIAYKDWNGSSLRSPGEILTPYLEKKGALSVNIPVSSDLNSSSTWTNLKIQKVAFSILAGISLWGAAVSLPFSPSFLSSISLAGISALALFSAYSQIDFDDPQVLASLKEEAVALSFPEILKKHDWKNIFSYNILSPQDFSKKYRTYVNTLPFAEILKLYKEAELALQNSSNALFSIPSLSEWKEKFEQEIKGLECSEIADKYPAEDLKAHGLISAQQFSFFKQAEMLKNEFLKNQAAIDRELSRKIGPYLKSFHSTIDAAVWATTNKTTYKNGDHHITVHQHINYDQIDKALNLYVTSILPFQNENAQHKEENLQVYNASLKELNNEYRDFQYKTINSPNKNWLGNEIY